MRVVSGYGVNLALFLAVWIKKKSVDPELDNDMDEDIDRGRAYLLRSSHSKPGPSGSFRFSSEPPRSRIRRGSGSLRVVLFRSQDTTETAYGQIAQGPHLSD
jgi:hypothetical protein